MYLNPLYNQSCPDPFVLKFCSNYYCYATGWAPDGRVFEILLSKDLIHWQSLGGAMEALPGDLPEYWAPEVLYSNGRFFLYYSVGDGVQMKLRAAISPDPQGPFHDSGLLLTQDDFAIDAHIFEDDDGARYMFYAKDFLDHTHIGTGTVMDKMLDELTLEGNPRPVSLPCFDWQVFDPNRIEKGGVRWHTIEGPFVLKYKGRYYQMFSGGNWKNLSYGVSYAVAKNIDSQQEWTQLEHNDNLPLVLATIPDKVIGPGHNSVVRGPDNRQLYCIYHRWSPDSSARLLSIDPLEWIGDRLSVFGPSLTAQENPNNPVYPEIRQVCGRWSAQGDLLRSAFDGYSEAEIDLPHDSYLIETSLSSISEFGSAGGEAFGMRFMKGQTEVLALACYPKQHQGIIRVNGLPVSSMGFPPDFSFGCHRLLRINVDGERVELHFNSRAQSWRGRMPTRPDRLCLYSDGLAASFKPCSITPGYEDIFWPEDSELEDLNWHAMSGNNGLWKIIGGELRQNDVKVLNSGVVKEHSFETYELAINARLLSGDDPNSCYGFYPALTETGSNPLLTVEARDGMSSLVWHSQQTSGVWPLPNSFDRYRAQQFRFRKINGILQVFLENLLLGALEVSNGPARAALYANRASVAYDLVRLTALDSGQ
jgi:GH43 family beta-xylosidase